MPHVLPRQIIAAIALAMALACAGCGAVIMGGAAAAGTYAYANGEAKGTYATDVAGAFDASLAACKDLGIPVVKESRTDTKGEVIGKLSGDRVAISLKLVGEGLTEITVRVGLWGNESTSRRIHSAIGQRL